MLIWSLSRWVVQGAGFAGVVWKMPAGNGAADTVFTVRTYAASLRYNPESGRESAGLTRRLLSAASPLLVDTIYATSYGSKRHRPDGVKLVKQLRRPVAAGLAITCLLG
jgi:hypothetical protein